MKFNEMIIIVVVALALLMETLDMTIISTAIPQIAADFGEDPMTLKFALTSYLLSLAIFIPISGWIADRFGARNTFFVAIILFTLGSIFCGLSTNLIELVLSRILQGLGGAFMMPVGRLILIRSFTRNQLIMITNAIAIPSLIGPALGPVVGGFITTFWSWRWIFFVNIPFAILAAALVIRYVAKDKKNKDWPLDIIGFLIFALALVSLSVGFETIGDQFISVHLSLTLMGIAILLLFIYKQYALHIKNPIIDLSLFNNETFKWTSVAIILSRFGFGGIPFLLPLLFQTVFYMTPLESGLLILPMPIGMLLIKFLVKPLLKAFGFKKVMFLTVVILALSIIHFSFLNHTTSVLMICVSTFIYGLACSLYYACTDVLIYSEVPEASMSRATSLVSTMAQLSMSFGIATSALILGYFNAAFNYTFLALGAITLTSAAIFICMKSDVGDAVCDRAG